MRSSCQQGRAHRLWRVSLAPNQPSTDRGGSDRFEKNSNFLQLKLKLELSFRFVSKFLSARADRLYGDTCCRIISSKLNPRVLTRSFTTTAPFFRPKRGKPSKELQRLGRFIPIQGVEAVGAGFVYLPTKRNCLLTEQLADKPSLLKAMSMDTKK